MIFLKCVSVKVGLSARTAPQPLATVFHTAGLCCVWSTVPACRDLSPHKMSSCCISLLLSVSIANCIESGDAGPQIVFRPVIHFSNLHSKSPSRSAPLREMQIVVACFRIGLEREPVTDRSEIRPPDSLTVLGKASKNRRVVANENNTPYLDFKRPFPDCNPATGLPRRRPGGNRP